jgi:hypothetical protein
MPNIEEIMTGTGAGAGPGPAPGNKKALPVPKQQKVSAAAASRPPKPRTARPNNRRRDTACSDYVYFESTPYTLTMPSFRHGPIRFTKATLGLEPQLLPDETLDWTAFQMAILGDAGDVFAESDEFTTRRRSEGENTDDLAAWLEGHGLSGCGSLVTSRSECEASSRVPSLVLSPSNKSDDSSASSSPATQTGDLPIPVRSEHPNGFWNEASVVDAARFAPSGPGCGVKRWTVEGHPKRPAASKRSKSGSGRLRRESLDSLPQSPMLDLVMNRDCFGKEYTVPMGYNLGHDLGDYLAWETTQVFTGPEAEESELP